MARDLIPGVAARTPGRLPGLTTLAALALLAGCATVPAEAPQRTRAPRDSAYLPSPMTGYPRSVGASDAEALRRAHQALVSGGDSASARDVARALLDSNPDFEPAWVLRAQAGFVDGEFELALTQARPIAERHPDYVAAQLLVGRAAEQLERVPEAFEVYSRIAARSELARRQAETLRTRAVEITGNRVEELVSRRRLEDAAGEVERLEAWAPDEARTFELVARYAGEIEDSARELAAVRRWILLEPSTELSRRQARLELEAGDSGEGLRILKELSEREPNDTELAMDLERAKFRWRLNLLPEDVAQLLTRPELARGDYAKLLFWLFPEVRYGRPSEGRIASDILDHPYRQEIARVVNLGLMRIDPTLHLFHPDLALNRRDALQSVVQVLGARRPRPACLGDADPQVELSVDTLCLLSARCGLLPETTDCLPEANASGLFVEGIGFAALEIVGDR